MSHFYGVLKGSRGVVTRCGTRSSGINVTAAGWRGAIDVNIWHAASGHDMFRVMLTPWHGSGDKSVELAYGRLDAALAKRDAQDSV